MGVERQHCAIYGYELNGRINYDDHPHLLEYKKNDAEQGEFAVYQNGWSSADNAVAGIVHFLTDSSRWEGPQTIKPIQLNTPKPVLVEAMESFIHDELPLDPNHAAPQHIVFTYVW